MYYCPIKSCVFYLIEFDLLKYSVLWLSIGPETSNVVQIKSNFELMYHHKFYRTDNSSLMIAAATHDLNCERRCAYQSFLGRKIFRCVAFKMSQYSQSILLLSLHFSYLHSRRLREHSGCIVLKVNVLRHVIHSLDIWAYKLSLKFYFIQVSIAVLRGDNWTPISYWVLDEHHFDSRCMSLFYISFKTLWWL